MGCTTAIFSRAETPIVPIILKLDDLRAQVKTDRTTIIASISRDPDVHATFSAIERPQVKIGMVCSIPDKWAIRFVKAGLVWEGDTNEAGVILYNTLISTDEWSLEEVVIEELL